MTPDDMRDELQAWNSGAGVSLDTWIAHKGNMKLAVGYTTVFWPKFKELEGYIVREEVTIDGLRSFAAQSLGHRSRIEAVLNHLHLADTQTYGDPHTTVDRLKFLMPVLKEIYEAKLAWQFPNRPCVVSLTYPEDEQDLIGYQITFWQKKYESA